jgi:tRNA(Ile)-lysidine synthase
LAGEDFMMSNVKISESQVSNPVVRKVERFLDRLGGLGGGVVVAVSGGPDSVALLRALLKVQPTLASGPIVIAHLNHLLRGRESDADEGFVRDLHELLPPTGPSRVILVCDRIDVRAKALEEKDNLENAARKYRYDWLRQTALNHGIRWIATGHTADDQAETVLHHLLRGTGLKGLRGIAERRRMAQHVFVIRPLLKVTRQEILSFLEAEGQPYQLDSSNIDLSYTRNRIRHELLPPLAKNYSPEIVSRLCRLAEHARRTYRRVEERARKLLARIELPRAGAMLVFDRETIASAPRNLVREAFRLVWQRENWPADAMTFEHWDRLANVALGEILAADFPGGVRARCLERVFQLTCI